MGNLDNKEVEFAEILKSVTRTARENKNYITTDEVKEAFSELELDDKQLQMVLGYLKNHKIGVDEKVELTGEDLTEEETNYLQSFLDSFNSLFSTHPDTAERIRILEKAHHILPVKWGCGQNVFRTGSLFGGSYWRREFCPC